MKYVTCREPAPGSRECLTPADTHNNPVSAVTEDILSQLSVSLKTEVYRFLCKEIIEKVRWYCGESG